MILLSELSSDVIIRCRVFTLCKTARRISVWAGSQRALKKIILPFQPTQTVIWADCRVFLGGRVFINTETQRRREIY